MCRSIVDTLDGGLRWIWLATWSTRSWWRGGATGRWPVPTAYPRAGWASWSVGSGQVATLGLPGVELPVEGRSLHREATQPLELVALIGLEFGSRPPSRAESLGSLPGAPPARQARVVPTSKPFPSRDLQPVPGPRGLSASDRIPPRRALLSPAAHRAAHGRSAAPRRRLSRGRRGIRSR